MAFHRPCFQPLLSLTISCGGASLSKLRTDSIRTTFFKSRVNVSADRYGLFRFPIRACAWEAAPDGWGSVKLSALPTPISIDSANSDLPGARIGEAFPLTLSDLLAIVYGESPDSWVNEIIRSMLGWRLDETGKWNAEAAPKEWRAMYPDSPPDFIGKEGDYTPQTDRPVKKAMQTLNRSIPREYKQLLKEVLGPAGFKGWKINELNSNRTRRATAVNYMLYWYKVHFPEWKWA